MNENLEIQIELTEIKLKNRIRALEFLLKEILETISDNPENISIKIDHWWLEMYDLPR